jgi:hypothetical protein
MEDLHEFGGENARQLVGFGLRQAVMSLLVLAQLRFWCRRDEY